MHLEVPRRGEHGREGADSETEEGLLRAMGEAGEWTRLCLRHLQHSVGVNHLTITTTLWTRQERYFDSRVVDEIFRKLNSC